MNPRKRLGEMLIDAGVLDEAQLNAALGHQRQWGMRLGQALVELKLVEEGEVVRALAEKLGFGVARLDGLEPAALQAALRLVPREFAVKNNVLPLAADTSTVTVAMSDPTNLAVVDEIRFRTGRRVNVCIGGDREVAAAVTQHYPGDRRLEAIALDFEVDEADGDPVHDPFGGGSSDALQAFYGNDEAPAPRPAAMPSPALAPARPRSAPAELELEIAAPTRAPAPESAADVREALLGAIPAGGFEPDDAAVLDPEPATHAGAGEEPSRDLTPRELAILDALDRMADGAPAQPEIVKPAHAMAALIRLLLHKRVITEAELLDELSRK